MLKVSTEKGYPGILAHVTALRLPAVSGAVFSMVR